MARPKGPAYMDRPPLAWCRENGDVPHSSCVEHYSQLGGTGWSIEDGNVKSLWKLERILRFRERFLLQPIAIRRMYRHIVQQLAWETAGLGYCEKRIGTLGRLVNTGSS